MKITICGSTAFIDEMEKLSKDLGEFGHDVKLPPVVIKRPDGVEIHTRDYYKFKKSMPKDESFWHDHTNRITNHFKKVEWCEAVLIANYDKNGIVGYVGPNTLMEMGVALYLNKKIFLLNQIPEVAWKEEILGVRPVVLAGDILKIE